MNLNDSIYLTQPNSFLSRPTFVWIENIWIPKLFSYSTSRTRFNRSSRGRAVFCVHPSQLHHFKSRVKWRYFGQSNVSGIAYSMTTSNNRKYHWLCLQVQGKNSFYLARSCCHPKHSSNQCLLSNWWLVNWGQPIKPTLWLHLQASRCANRTHSSIGLIV